MKIGRAARSLALFAALSGALPAGHLAAAELKNLPPRPAPALSLPALGGGALGLEQLRGKVVLVNFWAVWCPPCRKEMPSMARLADKLAGKPFAILGVNVGESPEEIRGFLAKVPVNFPIVMDSEGQQLKAWQVFAFPTSYVLDRKGNIRMGLFGSVEWDAPEVVARLEALLAEVD
ncbi:MAG: TlpA disulfide reductase family protein [Pseudomonadota bacterium]